MKSNNNLVFQTDSYKASHYLQFQPGTENNFYYIEARYGADFIKFFGLQAILKKMFEHMPTVQDIDRATKFYTAHGEPFNYEGWMALVKLGYYPLKIKAVTEGAIVATKRPLVTGECTVDGFEWLPGWIEPRIMQVWYPTTVATRSWLCKKVILKHLEHTGDPSLINFKLHDFGYRGVSSQESAEIGAMSHLVNFMGTDTIAGIFAAQEYYNTDEMVGFSIPAGEHSVYTSWGRDHEVAAYLNMLDKFAYPGKNVACVSDSYDLSNAVQNIWGIQLKQRVIDSGAVIIIRPDSGEPDVVSLRTIKELDTAYGSTVNSKGFKVLHRAVRVIQGDGIKDFQSIDKILNTIVDAGYSADNIAFGQGGGMLQQLDRDTYGFAMKCSSTKVNGTWRDVFKCPKDAPWKASKRGRFENDTALNDVFIDGQFVKEYTFQEVRDNESIVIK